MILSVKQSRLCGLGELDTTTILSICTDIFTVKEMIQLVSPAVIRSFSKYLGTKTITNAQPGIATVYITYHLFDTPAGCLWPGVLFGSD